MMRRLLMLLLILTLIFSKSALAQDVTKTKADIGTCFIQLEDYLAKVEEDTARLEMIRDNFDQIGGSNGKSLAIYCNVLIAVTNDDYELALIYIDLLNTQKDRLDGFLSESDSQYVEAFSVLEAYVYGRMAEAEGNINEAKQAYRQSITFLDSMERWNRLQEQDSAGKYEEGFALYREGKYAEALAVFESMSNQNYKSTTSLIESCRMKMAATVEPMNTKNAGSTKVGESVRVGGYVTFGHYPQTAEGNDNTLIEWFVLDIQGNQALLLSKFGLDIQPYNEKNVSVYWVNSTLREWMNGVFLNRAFTLQEQRAIVSTSVDNGKESCYLDWSTYGGSNTEDKLFVLSYAEARKYYRVSFTNGEKNNQAQLTPTAYAISKGATNTFDTASGKKTSEWWLRSPGYYSGNVSCITLDGTLSYINVKNKSICVRPAMWVNLDSDIF